MTPQPGSRFRRAWPFAALIVVIAAASWFGWSHFHRDGPKTASPPRGKGDLGKPPVPVTFTRVQTADFPVWLNGLGTVQPYDTVTVRSRVDGEVINIAFKQGQMIEEGAILAQIDPRPYQASLDQALAKKTQDEATLRDAQLNLARYGALANQEFASKQQLNTQQATVQQLMAQIKGDQAMIDNAQTQVGYTTIRSPLSGKVGFRTVDPGNIVHASDTTGIVTIVKLQPISVVFTAPEEDVQSINNALAAGDVPVTALSTDGKRTLSQGKLALVNNVVDQASGTVRMKATFENKDNALWPGLSVSTRLLLNTLKQVVVVPEEAIGHGPNGLYAFVIGDGNKVAMRPLKVGQEGDGSVVVADGLAAGDKIVVSGQYQLEQDVVVQPTQAGTEPPVSTAATARNEPAPVK